MLALVQFFDDAKNTLQLMRDVFTFPLQRKFWVLQSQDRQEKPFSSRFLFWQVFTAFVSVFSSTHLEGICGQ